MLDQNDKDWVKDCCKTLIKINNHNNKIVLITYIEYLFWASIMFGGGLVLGYILWEY